MALLAQRVIYMIAPREATKTVKGEREYHGSIYHVSLTVFAGVIGAVNVNPDDPLDLSYDLALFVPASLNLRWIYGIREGRGPGMFQVFEPELSDSKNGKK